MARMGSNARKRKAAIAAIQTARMATAQTVSMQRDYALGSTVIGGPRGFKANRSLTDTLKGSTHNATYYDKRVTVATDKAFVKR